MASISDIRACGLSLRKAEYIHNAAKTHPIRQIIITVVNAYKLVGCYVLDIVLLWGFSINVKL